jgi:predicted membrane-bound mannosyltransferase
LSTYVYWLVRQESPNFFLGILGAAMLVWKPRSAFALFVALWGFGITAAYSLISYKTPWLGLNFIIPLALTGGYALQQIYEESSGQLGLAAGILAAAVAVSGYQTVDLNFFNYDNDDQYYVYVYAHTRREVLAMLQEIDQIAARTQQGGQMGITIVAPEYWPLPWYFRDYRRVGYSGRLTTTNEPVIIAAENQGADVQTMFGDTYRQIPSGLNPAGSYALRPGVSFLLYVRRDVAPAGS